MTTAAALSFLVNNWQGIVAIIAMVGHLFPSKTAANKIADKISKNPEAVAALGKKISDWSKLNK